MPINIDKSIEAGAVRARQFTRESLQLVKFIADDEPIHREAEKTFARRELSTGAMQF